MLNKRISVIALSFLLAFSPMYSPVCGSTAAASENEAVSDEAMLEDTNSPETEAASDTGTTKDNECSMAPIDFDEDENPADPVIDEDGNPGDDENPANPVIDEDENTDEDANTAYDEKNAVPEDNEGPLAPIDYDSTNSEADGGNGTNGGQTADNEEKTGDPNDNEGPLVPIDDEDTEGSCDVNGHKFGDWKVVTPPTTRTDGKSERTCSVCGKTESKVVAHTILKVKTITISRSSVTLLNGRSVQLWAKPAPADATNTAVVWKSSNTSVATVTSTGKVTTKRRGTATITCTAKDGGGAKASCTITVNLGVSKIALDRTSLALNKGRTFTLKATVLPAAATNKAVTWKSSNTKVATVTSTGKVTFKARGTATITCAAKDGSGTTASCKVTVRIPVSVINLGRSSATLVKGKTLTLRAGVGPASASNRTVSWKSSNANVATVSPTGTITAKGKGTAVITCSARDGSGVKATCRITVTAPAPAPAKSTGDSGSGIGDYVWISATGSKYHKKNDCGTMNPNKASRVTTEEARSRGLEPCQKCFP